MIELATISSNALHENVTLRIVTPSGNRTERILFLLHGSISPEGDYSLIEKMPQDLGLEKLCNQYKLITITPYMKNCYYISSEQYNCDLFISEELPEWICSHYSLPDNMELILGGISMGGYGAVLIGVHTNVFHKIISISGAFITNDIEIGNPEIWGNMLPDAESVRNTYLSYFLPLEELHESKEKNVFAALRSLDPKLTDRYFVVTCGTDDRMLSRNELLTGIMRELKIDHNFMKFNNGGHDNACFRKGLWEAVARLIL